ncbi:glyoxylate/succinic semialdehyde reductase 2, chloroplastic isoform X2 [Punica granatum]|uniref:Glyoxylate/succinic semialdehyde reductase 2, chloroplastic isoform X2 n=1 Tax=Punica granatum TaxID=22663 RepID=A0A6P8E038_PUNGR|nr:glyoxylate/succinic semialdehyde reductase 2, chloroplastic isoform X2 [Punica granatum]
MELNKSDSGLLLPRRQTAVFSSHLSLCLFCFCWALFCTLSSTPNSETKNCCIQSRDHSPTYCPFVFFFCPVSGLQRCLRRGMKLALKPSYGKLLCPAPMAVITSQASTTFCPPVPARLRVRGWPFSFLPGGSPALAVPVRAFSASASASEFPERVGFLGMGIMGTPMAQNLIKAGCDVTVWNRTKSKCDPLTSLGAKFKPSPEEVAASCDVTFAMLADPESAVEVACGKLGAANGMGPGKGYVDVSTVDGATSKLIGERIKATGALFLEAPVSGSKKPAEDGQLIFLTAGDKALYGSVSSLLDIMGKSSFYLGDVGNGAAMKLVVNMIMGSMMASFSEGLLLSEKVGLDPNVLVEVVSHGAISAPMYKLKGPSMVQSQYPTAFPLKHQQKLNHSV